MMMTKTDNLLEAHWDALRALTKGREPFLVMRRFARMRQQVTPLQLIQCDDLFRSYCGPNYHPGFWAQMLSQKAPFDELLAKTPELARVAIHARDGFVREKAIEVLPDPEGDPLDLTALLCRCNDNVPQVREAALARWRDLCQLPQVEALGAVLPILLDRVPSWRRGGSAALALVAQRPDSRRLLEEMFLTERTGPLAKRMRFVLRKDVLDPSLGLLATRAASSAVRAVATEALLTGETKCKVGMEWQWLDKSLGQRRRVAMFETRALDVPAELRVPVTKAAARDPSVAVRKLAADRLIVTGPEGFGPEVAMLRADPKGSLKERMDYFERKFGAVALEA